MAKKESKRAFEKNELLEDIPCSTSSTHIITVYEKLPRGDIFIVVRDYFTMETISELEYQLDGNETSFSGSTNKKGLIFHDNVPAGHYILTINDIKYLVPTVEYFDDPYQLLIFNIEHGMTGESNEDNYDYLDDYDDDEPMIEDDEESVNSQEDENDSLLTAYLYEYDESEFLEGSVAHFWNKK